MRPVILSGERFVNREISILFNLQPETIREGQTTGDFPARQELVGCIEEGNPLS